LTSFGHQSARQLAKVGAPDAQPDGGQGRPSVENRNDAQELERQRLSGDGRRGFGATRPRDHRQRIGSSVPTVASSLSPRGHYSRRRLERGVAALEVAPLRSLRCASISANPAFPRAYREAGWDG